MKIVKMRNLYFPLSSGEGLGVRSKPQPNNNLMEKSSYFPNVLFLSTLLLFTIPQISQAQELEDTSSSIATPTGLGNGLNFNLNDGDYQFKISGLLQPVWQHVRPDGSKAENTFLARRTFLNFSGKALKEKLSFFIQTDFTANVPLLDAYVAYHVTERWNVSVGQRRTFTNNREMTWDEDKIQYTERGFLSANFNQTGREFGLFVDGKLGKDVVLHPQLAITSGDGANSFGVSSTDVDMGGVKYGGRLDVYPLGEFKKGNMGFTADLMHEDSPKLLLGSAFSLNRGASSARGEGHGDFMFYGSNKQSKLPDYRKFSADILLKYKGFSLLGEFTNASAYNLNGIYLDSSGAISSILKPGQISNFLVLGQGWNVQTGYVTKSGFALDVRFEKLTPEFNKEARSVLQETQVSTLGLTKYFPDNHMKVQLSLSQLEVKNRPKALQSELLFQVVF